VRFPLSLDLRPPRLMAFGLGLMGQIDKREIS